jgi:hypothetical protein
MFDQRLSVQELRAHDDRIDRRNIGGNKQKRQEHGRHRESSAV